MLLLTLIGESEQIKRTMIRLYICYQSKFNQMVSRIIPNRCACLSECMVRTQCVKVLFPTKRNCSWNVNFFYLAKRGLEGFVVRVSECSHIDILSTIIEVLTKRTVFLVVTILRVYLEAVAREERLTSQTVFTPFVFAWKYECK